MPAQTMKAETDEMEVRASWDENIFPEDVTMVVRKANAEQVRAAAEAIIGDDAKVVDAIAVDITFYSFEGGKHEVQPKDPSGVHVSLSAKRAIEGETHQVVHIDKNGDAEKVSDATKTGASFDSVGFSTYAVVGSDGKSADEEEVRRTYIFYMPANNDPSYDHATEAQEWDRQVVKNGDVLVEPGTPSLTDKPDTYFAGWYEEGSDTRMTFGGKVNDIPTAMGSQDQEVKVYAKYADRYVAYFFDTEDDVEHEVVGTAGDSISMDKDIAGLEEQGMRLVGWSTTKGSTTPEYALTDSFTFTDDDVNFYPVVETIRKIQFEEGSEEASFTNPVYVTPGEAIPAVAEPTRPGYTFTGWYEDEACTRLFDRLTAGTKTMPEGAGPLVLYAGWEAGEVEFEVFVWGEYDGTGEYEVKYSYKDKLPAGTVVTEQLARQNYAKNVTTAIFDSNYYVLNEDKSFTNLGGSIKGDGSSIYNIYFDRKSYTITYQYTNYSSLAAAGGEAAPAPDELEKQTVKFGQQVTPINPVTITKNPSNGYTFSGWSTQRYGNSFTMPDVDDIVFYGSFSHKDNVSYIVEHYKHDLDAENNKLFDTYTEVEADEESKTGSAGAGAIYTQKDYTGYEFEKVEFVVRDGETDTVATDTKIDGNGKTVVKVYYQPKQYNVNYQYTNATPGSTPDPTQAKLAEASYTKDYYYGATVSPEAAATADGYTFSGWKHRVGVDSGKPAADFADAITMPARNVVITGTWTANTDTKYTVVHHFETETPDTYDTKYIDDNGDEQTCSGHEYTATTGTNVTASVDEYHGYTFVEPDADEKAPSKITGQVTGDGKLVLDLYYQRNKDYKITYRFDGEYPSDVKVPDARENLTYGVAYDIDTDTKDAYGYTFNGWETRHEGVEIENGKVTMPARDVELIGTWTPKNTEYTIEHMVKSLTGDDYELYGTAYTRSGATGTDGYAVPIANPGLKVNNDKTREANEGYQFTPETGDTVTRMTAPVKADKDGNGTTVFVYYYDRNTYPVTYEVTDPKGATVPTEDDQAYGASVSVKPELSVPGYIFDGWKTTDVTVSDDTFTMPAGPVKFTGSFIPGESKYKVEYYWQTLDLSGYELHETLEDLTGTTESTVSAEEKAYTGFTLTEVDDGTNKTIASDTLKGDGSTVLRLYYNRNSYNVIYHYTGAIPPGATPPETVKAVPFGQEFTIAELPDDSPYADYMLLSTEWEKAAGSDLSITDGTFNMPARDVNLTVKWAEDKNRTGIDDATEEYTVIYQKGEHGAFTEEVAGKTTFDGLRLNATIPVYDGEVDADKNNTPQGEAGYVFSGWKPSRTTVKAEYCEDGTATIYLVAQWLEDKNDNGIPDEREEFTVIYKKGDHGAFTEDANDATRFESLATEDPTPAYAGDKDASGKPKGEADWTFADWKPSVAEKVDAADADKDSVITYTATWKEDKNNNGVPDEDEYRTISYTDGVEDAELFADKVFTKQLDGLATPAFGADPTRTDYVFTGWNPSVAGVVDGDAVYTATWAEDKNHDGIPDAQQNYTVTFDSNGKELKGEAPKDQNIGFGKKVTEPSPVPEAEKAVFRGWYKDNLGTEPWDFDADTVTKDVTLYVKWSDDKNDNGIADEDETFTVIYDLDGGTTTSPVTVFEGLRLGVDVPTIAVPTKDGFVFDQWSPVFKDRVSAADADTDCKIIYKAIWKVFDPVKSGDATDPDGIVSGDPSVKKIVKGDGAPKNDKFTFQLKADGNTAGLDQNPMPNGASGDIITIQLSAGEELEFGEIEFAYPGVYTYTITELDEGLEGYTYDATVYTVIYTVSQEDGILSCIRTIQKNGEDVTVATYEFENAYMAPDSDKDDKPKGDEPTEPEEPGKPGEPVEPGKPDEPSKPDEPTKPEKPGKPEGPTKPGEPGKPEGPTKPEDDNNDSGKQGGVKKGTTPTIASASTSAPATTTKNPAANTRANTPKTGDESNIMLWLGLMMASLTLLCVAGYMRRHTEPEIRGKHTKR